MEIWAYFLLYIPNNFNLYNQRKVRLMGIETSKKKENEPIIIELTNYNNLNVVLSKILIPFSEVMGNSNVPDVYAGYEKIPFEKRDPLYKTIMRQEFANAIKALKPKIK